MPSLPEIEVIRRDLEKEVVGRRIKEAEVRPTRNAMKVIRRHGRRKEFQDMLVGAKVDGIERSGRLLFFDLDNDNVFVVDLGTTGRLLKTSASEAIAPHTHIVLSFTIGGQLRVLDSKLTGEVFVAPAGDVAAMPELKTTALDPLDNQSPLTWQAFSSLLEEHGRTMKELLTDERFIVGLGEIYSDEVLFAAGLRYDRSSDRLTSQDVRRLYRALLETAQEAVKARGTSWGADGFRDLQGNEGMFQIELKVYERAGEPCRRCRNQIERAEFNGGASYFCPQCQS
ncbi:MAG: bifunctional DNA-formamidopyrimidine glycosylase/DNA-(apurinic or apyrimidinic site) lyase [Actinomycetota bacterium]